MITILAIVSTVIGLALMFASRSMRTLPEQQIEMIQSFVADLDADDEADDRVWEYHNGTSWGRS